MWLSVAAAQTLKISNNIFSVSSCFVLPNLIYSPSLPHFLCVLIYSLMESHSFNRAEVFTAVQRQKAHLFHNRNYFSDQIEQHDDEQITASVPHVDRWILLLLVFFSNYVLILIFETLFAAPTPSSSVFAAPALWQLLLRWAARTDVTDCQCNRCRLSAFCV